MTTGVCTGCGRTYTLRRVTGMVRTHGRPHCPGSNQAPAHQVDMVATEPGPMSVNWDDIVPSGVIDPAGNGVASILDEHPTLAPIGDVAQEMAREHNDLLRMADYRSLERWAAGMRDEIAARAEERDVRNARYDQWLDAQVAEIREWLAGVAS